MNPWELERQWLGPDRDSSIDCQSLVKAQFASADFVMAFPAISLMCHDAKCSTEHRLFNSLISTKQLGPSRRFSGGDVTKLLLRNDVPELPPT
jgi:hypothetical protein